MEINNNKLNSLPEQVEENMLNIKLLAQYLTEAYKTSLTLTNITTSIAISDTNADSDTTKGWLFDSVGNLFKITNGDGTNLLLDYYTNLKGQQGAQGIPGQDGADLEIDDTSINLDKVWSSYKTNDMITGRHNLYFTATTPTPDPEDLTGTKFFIDKTNVDFCGSGVVVKANDFLFFVENGAVTKSYVIINVGETQLKIQTYVNIGKSKQLYQHNLMLGTSANNLKLRLQIINDDNTPFTNESFLQYLNSNGFVNVADDGANQKKTYMCTGKYLNASNVWFVVTDINYYDIDTYAIFGLQFSGGAYSRITTLSVNSINNVVDTIIAL